MASQQADPFVETVAPQAPVTSDRKLNENLQNELPKPYLARAQAAVDKFHPEGTEGWDRRGMTVLQQHVSFFDRNKDGIIYPWESFQGFRAIGCNLLVSIVGAFLGNAALSYATQPGWLPSPLLSVHVKNIHKGKHGSDSEVYDTEGRFEPSKFEAIFSKYSAAIPDALSERELNTMLKANRNLHDYGGWFMTYAEWKFLYTLGKDEEGFLRKETIRAVYDGSLFEKLEKANASRSRRD